MILQLFRITHDSAYPEVESELPPLGCFSAFDRNLLKLYEQRYV